MKRVERLFQVRVTKKYEEPKEKLPDSFPQGKTEEDLKTEYSTLVYCNFVKCVNNKRLEGLKQSVSSVTKQLGRVPWEDDPEWRGVCTRGVIAIDFQTITASGAKFKYPTCYVPSVGVSGHMDFSKIAQSYSIPDQSDPVYRETYGA